ncbi:MAG TPA: glycosyl hydrolase family 28-related protein [Opitutaceae bacterium]|nr:glycosyl hydrolase family 28-related protein [Opitutaceae bacterium]
MPRIFALLLGFCLAAHAIATASPAEGAGRAAAALPVSAIAAAGSGGFAPPHFPVPTFRSARYNVRDFGATGDGVTNDTAAIDRAIDACAAAGGGDVVFPAGTYAAASIHLRSNLRFVLAPDAVITGADHGYDAPEANPNDRYQDFGHSHFHNALMWGENLENFALVGGHVNGGHIIQGEPKPKGRDIGDKVIAVRVGRNLLFQGVTHDTGGHFVYLLDDCENVTLDHVTIRKSRDAVDFMGCRDVQVHDCRFTGCADDTIGVKSDWALGRKIDTANVYVWDCYFESGCNGLQFGSETAGDFHHCYFWNIRIGRAMKAGIGITCNDGGVIDGVNYRDITITGAAVPIYLLVTDRLRTGDPAKKTGTIRNVRITNVTVTDCEPGRQGPVNTAAISGRPESAIENVVLENVKLVYPGNGRPADVDVVPPYPKDYSPRSLGPRPAAGLYVRHVRGLTLRNVEIAFDHADPRPALVASDVDGLTLDRFQAGQSTAGKRIRLDGVRGFTVTASPGLADEHDARAAHRVE